MKFAPTFSYFEKSMFPRLRRFNLQTAVLLAMVLVAYILMSMYQYQSAVIAAHVAGNEVLIQSLTATSPMSLLLGVGLTSAILLVVAGGAMDVWRERTAQRHYQTYLSEFSFDTLATQARGLETDAYTRAQLVSYLTQKRPGWSYL